MQDDTPQPGWTYKPADDQPAKSSHQPATDSVTAHQQSKPKSPHESEVSWTASEFVANHKSPGWYAQFIIGLGLAGALIYLITKDVMSVGVIVIAGILFLILASRQPRQLSYKVDSQGITIGGKFYSYNLFKSFGVGYEGVIGTINLMPLKRFMPELSIYYPPEEEKKIIDIIAVHLPNEQREEPGVDRLLKKMRF